MLLRSALRKSSTLWYESLCWFYCSFRVQKDADDDDDDDPNDDDDDDEEDDNNDDDEGDGEDDDDDDDGGGGGDDEDDTGDDDNDSFAFIRFPGVQPAVTKQTKQKRVCSWKKKRPPK